MSTHSPKLITKVDATRSRAAKKAAITRALNRRLATRSQLRVHHKVLAGGAILAVLVFTFLGIRSQLETYAASTSTGTFVGLGDKCLDNAGSRLANGNRVQLYKCNGTSAQKWVLTSTGALRANNGSTYCLDVPGNSRAEYTYLQIYRCNGSSAQHFNVADTTIVAATTGFCATVRYAETSNRTRIWMKSCHASTSQGWRYSATSPAVTSSASPRTTSGSGSSTGANTATGSGTVTTGGASSGAPSSSQWGAAFGSRPVTSTPVNCNGQSNVTISGHTFKSIGNDTPSITINNCTNVTVMGNDFVDDTEPIYVVNSKNVTISWNRYQNITGPHTRNGSNRGNFTQWVNSFGGSIHNNKGIGGDTEDIVSIYKSGGASATSPLVIENNAFQGSNWTSTSGSGLMLGDGGGSHIVARNNTLVNPGQVGIGVSGGTDIHVTGNTVYGEKRTGSNVGIYVANYSGAAAMGGIEVGSNTVSWKNASGVNNGGYDSGSAGPVTGWSTNMFNANLTITSLAVSL